MSNLHIDKDGGISIPFVGEMKVTVEMTEEMFEEFLQYRKNKEGCKETARKEIDSVRGRMNALATAVIKSVDAKTPAERKDAKEDAHELANDWFA